jgi:hypothetical protein
MEAYEIDALRARPLCSGPRTPYSLCSSSIPLVDGSDRWRQSETGERSICSSSDLKMIKMLEREDYLKKSER